MCPHESDAPSRRRRALGRGPGAAQAEGAAPVPGRPPPAELPASSGQGRSPSRPAERPPAEEPAVRGPAEAGEPGSGEAAASGPEQAAVPAGAGAWAEEAAATGPDTEGGRGADDEGARFTVRLGNFEGPFDLLLQLIARHKMDVTEVALSRVTDDFMAYIRGMGPDWDLDQATEFLVVAATLLDLKAARLLPAAEVEDEADLALLEARDLLFARLLQYRAYKQVAGILGERMDGEGRRYPRTVGLEPEYAELLPDVVIGIGAEGFARLAVKAMRPRPRPQVYVEHIHAPLVSVREQAAVVVALLRERGSLSFPELSRDADGTLTVVARFLALLELYRDKAVGLEQPEPLGLLTVHWTGGDGDPTVTVTDAFDQEDA
ncbi:segregation/condensation protein A [Streptomyces sp. MUM 203J]|uniref:segregation and condensation protein A n=1 Tax=Streptomyces sp. MUM 203J TaxID=2791990 RepID=UPI001F0486D2|nr:segregation/condensation protein A [Streptomyces sp. MUM 203J]MCH0543253.1 segregation/condensation protein A [Streptomyces sp. MUM 203J]